MIVTKNGDRLAQAERILLETVKLAKRNEIEFEKWKEEQTKQQAERQAEWDKLRQEQAERDRKWGKQMGELSNKMGTLVEDFVIPNMATMLCLIDPSLAEDEIAVNARVKKIHRPTKQQIEIDAIADNGKVVLVNETKTTMKIEYIQDFVANRLTTFKEFFPEYQHQQVYGMVSSLRLDPSIVTYATRQGLLVVALKSGLMQVVNEIGFVPKQF